MTRRKTLLFAYLIETFDECVISTSNVIRWLKEHKDLLYFYRNEALYVHYLRIVCIYVPNKFMNCTFLVVWLLEL